MRLGKFGWMLAVTGVVMAGCPAGDDGNGDRCARDVDCGAGQQCETARSSLAGFFQVRTDGSRVEGSSLVFPGDTYTVSGANRERAELVVSICADPASTTRSTAFYFTNGNFLCFQANYQ